MYDNDAICARESRQQDSKKLNRLACVLMSLSLRSLTMIFCMSSYVCVHGCSPCGDQTYRESSLPVLRAYESCPRMHIYDIIWYNEKEYFLFQSPIVQRLMTIDSRVHGCKLSEASCVEAIYRCWCDVYVSSTMWIRRVSCWGHFFRVELCRHTEIYLYIYIYIYRPWWIACVLA